MNIYDVPIAILAENVMNINICNNNIKYVGNTDGTFANNVICLSNASNISIDGNIIRGSIPSADMKWIEKPVGSSNWVAEYLSSAVLFDNSMNVTFINNKF